MSPTSKTILALFLGLGALGWLVGVAMTVHANKLAQDNRELSSVLNSSLLRRASLVHQIEQLSEQQLGAKQMTRLQAGRRI